MNPRIECAVQKQSDDMLTKLALEQARTFADLQPFSYEKILTSEVKINRMTFISVLYFVFYR